MTIIDTVKAQDKLKPRTSVYWHRLGKGRAVGLRKTASGMSWHAQAYDETTGKQVRRALGDFTHLPPSDRYTAAVKAATEWLDHVGAGGSVELITVRKACEHYVEHQRAEKGEIAAKEAERRFIRDVFGDPIASVPLQKLKKEHVKSWRKRIEATPVRQPKRGANCRVKTPQPPAKTRSASTLNRDLVAVRAALNLAKESGHVASDMAWRSALKPTKGADGRREVYLSPDQRRALLAELPEDLAAFARGLCLLPLRPGALAALSVADFDRRTGALYIPKDKAGEKRHLPLPPATAELIRKQAAGKLPSAPLFTRWDGSAWTKDAWKKPVKAAAEKAKLPDSTVLYALRHSAITDLVESGLDLFTVAALAGTSIRMIEAHYGHLQADRAREALARLAL